MESESAAVVDVKDKKKWLENAFKKKDDDTTISTTPQSRNLVEDRHQWIQDKLLTQPKDVVTPQSSVSEAPKCSATDTEEPEPTNELCSTERVDIEEESTKAIASTADLEVVSEPVSDKDETQSPEVNGLENDAIATIAESNKVDATSNTTTTVLQEVEMQEDSELASPDTNPEVRQEPKSPEITENKEQTERNDRSDNNIATLPSNENQKEVIDVHGNGTHLNEGPLFVADETIDEPPEELEYPEEAIDPLPEESDDDEQGQKAVIKPQTEAPIESTNADGDKLDPEKVASEQIDPTPSNAEAPVKIDKAAEMESIKDVDKGIDGDRDGSASNVIHVDGPTKAIENKSETDESAADVPNHVTASNENENNNVFSSGQHIQPAEAAGPSAAEDKSSSTDDAQPSNETTEEQNLELPIPITASNIVDESGPEEVANASGISETAKALMATPETIATKEEDCQEKSNESNTAENTEHVVSITTSMDEEDVCEPQIEITQLSTPIPDDDPVFLGDFESPHKDTKRGKTANPDESSTGEKCSTTNEELLCQDTTEETMMASNVHDQPDDSIRRENDKSSEAREEQRPVRVKDIITSLSSESSANNIGLTPLAHVAVHSSTNPNSPINAGDKAGINKHVIDMSQMDFLYTRKGKAFVEQAKKNARKLREVRDDILNDECCSGVLAKETAANQDPPLAQVPSLLDKDRSDHEVTDSSDVHYSKQGSTDVHQGPTQPTSPSRRSEADSSTGINVQCLEYCSIM